MRVGSGRALGYVEAVWKGDQSTSQTILDSNPIACCVHADKMLSSLIFVFVSVKWGK